MNLFVRKDDLLEVSVKLKHFDRSCLKVTESITACCDSQLAQRETQHWIKLYTHSQTLLG